MTKRNWNPNLYDNKFSFVSKYGSDLVKLLAPKQGEKILDLGSGTGDLANALSNYGVEIIGVDKSENMVEQAIKKYPQIPFKVQDATTLDYDSQFDAVFSNATLHWVQPPIQALQGIYQSLKTGGRFVAEFGGKDNIKTITSAIMKGFYEAGLEFNEKNFLWFFPSIAEYSSLMEKVGFRVTFAEHFDRPTLLEGENGLRNFIHMFAQQIFDGISEHVKDEIITNVEQKLKGPLYQEDKWLADYKRIRVVGIKE